MTDNQEQQCQYPIEPGPYIKDTNGLFMLMISSVESSVDLNYWRRRIAAVLNIHRNQSLAQLELEAARENKWWDRHAKRTNK